jgi:2-polyprenyl-3-methyl-5-hydroxy-6-metoxy-1,4-benzoquinol methylase
MENKAVRVDPEQYEFDALLASAGDLTGKRVLEIGCGNGRITTHLAQFAAHVTAIDPNEERIAQAIEQMPPDLADKISYQAIPLADVPAGERFDLVLLSWSL